MQDGELTRIGGNEVIKTDVRVVAATNIDLEKAIEDRQISQRSVFSSVGFSDNYAAACANAPKIFNLWFFTFSNYTKKKPDVLFREFPKKLFAHLSITNGLGNVRELENAIERAVIIASGRQIELDDLPEAISKKAFETHAQARQERDQSRRRRHDRSTSKSNFRQRWMKSKNRLLKWLWTTPQATNHAPHGC